MTRLATAILICLAVAGCATGSHQSSIIATARGFAQASPKCKAILGEYPSILDNAQELPSQYPTIAVAFDHDELIKAKAHPDGKSRLNVRILVEIDSPSGNLKNVKVKRTTY